MVSATPHRSLQRTLRALSAWYPLLLLLLLLLSTVRRAALQRNGDRWATYRSCISAAHAGVGYRAGAPCRACGGAVGMPFARNGEQQKLCRAATRCGALGLPAGCMPAAWVNLWRCAGTVNGSHSLNGWKDGAVYRACCLLYLRCACGAGRKALRERTVGAVCVNATAPGGPSRADAATLVAGGALLCGGERAVKHRLTCASYCYLPLQC